MKVRDCELVQHYVCALKLPLVFFSTDEDWNAPVNPEMCFRTIQLGFAPCQKCNLVGAAGEK